MSGVLGAVQPKINAVLGQRAGSPFYASVVNFLAALVVVIVVLAVRSKTRRTLRALPSWRVPRWTLLAGLGGATIVVAGAVAVGTIGVAIFSVALYAGQITFGLIVDRLGLGPGGRRPVTGARIGAALLAVAAVVVAQVGRPVGEFSIALVTLVVVAGAAFAVQVGFNGRIAEATGDAWAATAVNVMVGLIALLAITGGLLTSGRIESPTWPGSPGLYTGGVLGVTVVVSLAFATRALGVLTTTIAMLATQLSTAFVIDRVVEGEPPTAGAIAGSLLIVVAAVLVGRARAAAARPAGTAAS